MEDLDRLLDDIDTQPVPEAPQEPTDTVVEDSEVKAEGQDDDQAGDKPNEPETPPVEGQEPSKDTPHVPRAALEDERRKRQESERAMKQLQQQMAAVTQAQLLQAQQAKQPQQQVEVPDMFEDPAGYQAYQDQRFNQGFRAIQRQFEDKLFETKSSLDLAYVRSQKPDYDDVESVFLEAANAQMQQGDTSLRDQMLMSPTPAQFAYDQGKRIKLMQDMGSDPEAYITKQVEERLAQAGATAPNGTQPNAAPPPKSLAGTASAQPRNSNGQWGGPAKLEQLLED